MKTEKLLYEIKGHVELECTERDDYLYIQSKDVQGLFICVPIADKDRGLNDICLSIEKLMEFNHKVKLKAKRICDNLKLI